MSENQQTRLFIGCVYAEVNQQNQCSAYVRCFSRNASHPYVQVSRLRYIPSPKKKLQKKFIIL